MTKVQNSRLEAVVSAEAFHWGAEVGERYHGVAAEHMDAQWQQMLKPFFDRYPFDLTEVVDFAAGYGRNTRKLLETGARHVTMVDVNQDCIAHLRENLQQENVTAVQNNGFDLSPLPDGRYTFLYSFDAMVHFDLEIAIAYLPEFQRILKSESYALIHHSNYSANPGGDFTTNPHMRNYMTAGIFKHVAMRNGFDVVEQWIFSWGEPDNDCITVLRKR
ncbi:class I SAM-dependent methyltransferase [Methylobacterium variabile]|jgi:ubiquinone/menaquinone biosynthesis C-methylase UbiE|uniref:class I SAM-dependent methyltransferase n=1 Tax=Methylobacterium variabile TaxID=298794 RepID=UPI00069D6106|nr:class I SAM-dependent methyltransferase [Methylobacterium variabile]